MSTLTNIETLLSSISTATSNSGVANVIGSHLTSSANTTSSIHSLLLMVNPGNAAQIASQIAALPGVPETVTPLLEELATAKDQATITTVTLAIEGALNSSTGSLGSILSAL